MRYPSSSLRPWSLLALGAVLPSCSSGETVTLGRAPVAAEGTAEVPASDERGDAAPAVDEGAPTEPAATADAGDTGEPEPEVTPEAGPVVSEPSTGQSDGGAGEPSEDPTGETPPSELEALDFEAPELVPELFSDTKDDNPTLTSDLLQVFFSSSRGEDTDIYWASRGSTAEAFAEPVRLEALSTSRFDASPALEADGLTLWFSRESEDNVTGLDIWVSRRSSREQEWSEPELVSSLNSELDDIARPTGGSGLLMPMGSRRDGDLYQTYVAARASLDSDFAAPVLAVELSIEGQSTADAFLTADGLTILYSHSVDEAGDLFVASRASLEQPFGAARPLDTINTEFDDRDPWLSPDGGLLFFSSDRGGALAIYQAQRLR